MPASRVATCPTCSSVVADSDRFCKQCGTEVSGISAAVVSDRAGFSPNTPPPSGGDVNSPWELVLTRLRAVTAGEFEIGRELGRGGMAAVFLAQDLSLNRKVAIKVMAPGLMLGADMVQRFRREAITIANLQHAHIVTVHAVRQMEDLHFFVMQFVEGQSLDGVLRAHGKLPVSLVLPILHQVGSALAYAHRRGVIHRDIKPGNILLSGDGDALVTDFGIAKVAEGPTQTQTGMVVGTPSYMSPEQCYATELDGASDQYSLGIVAFQMLCGRVPFVGGTFEIMKGHTIDPVPSLRTYAPDVPETIDTAIQRMLAKKPTDRFASFGEALQALGAHPLGEHSALRDEMVRLAAVEERRDSMGDLLRTPSSPHSGPRSGPMGSGGKRARTPAPVTIPIAVAIAPPPATLEVGEAVTLRATVRGAGESPALRWSTATPSLVRIDEVTGELLALDVGEAVAVAQIADVIERVTVLVVAPRVIALNLSRPDDDIHAGDVFTLTAQPTDRRGRPIAQRVEWRAIGTSATIAADGTVRALTPGRTDIVAVCQDVSETIILTIRRARVASLEIAPPAEPIEAGHSAAFGLVVRDALGAIVSDRPVSWSVDRHSEGTEHARIDAAGVMTALTEGAVTVRVRCEEVDSALEVRIQPARVMSVRIEGAPALLRDGDRFTLSATARDARGTILPRTVQWHSSNPAVASIDARGAVQAHAAGSVEIAVTCDAVSATVTLVVHATHPLFAGLGAEGAPEIAAPASATALLAGLEKVAPVPEVKPDPSEPLHVANPPASAPSAASVPFAASAPSASATTDEELASVFQANPASSPASPRADAPVRAKRPAWMYAAALVPVVAVVVWLFTLGDNGSGSAEVASTATPSSTPVAGDSTGDRTGNGTGNTTGNAAAPANPTGVGATPPIPDSAGDATRGTEASTGRESAPPAASAKIVRLIAPSSSTLRVAESIQLRARTTDRATGRDVAGDILFSSSDRRIATVNAQTGAVTAIAPGRVTITADGGESGRQSVTLTVQAARTEVATRDPRVALDSPPSKPPVAVDSPRETPPSSTTGGSTTPVPPPAKPVPSQSQLASEARAVVDAFARAFESRDIAQVRAVYGAISPGYAADLTGMFDASRSVRVTVNTVRVTSSSGAYEATTGSQTRLSVAVTIAITPTRGRATSSNDTWPIVLQRDESRWRLVQVGTP